MKATGIVRKVDELGRIVLPIELRRTLNIEEKDSLEIFVDGRGIRGSCGDILYIPRGTSVRFSSPETVRAVYFTYPADWENAAE